VGFCAGAATKKFKEVSLGSARASRPGDGALAIANFDSDYRETSAFASATARQSRIDSKNFRLVRVIRVIRRQKCDDHNRNIESLAKWIEGAIQRFRSGVKNFRVIELHDTNHYVFIVDERFTRRGGR
jgi:hypothetical protein